MAKTTGTASARNAYNGRKLFRNIICIFLCILSLFPFYILFTSATLPSSSIQAGHVWLPGTYLIKNYQGLMKRTSTTAMVGMWKAMRNSLIVTVPTVFLQVYFASVTAYGVTVYDFKFKNAAWTIIYAIMMIPTQVSIVGFLNLTYTLHISGTYLPLIIPAIAAPTTVYFMKQYMQTGLSMEIIEAARIDGAGELRTFNSIVIPLLMPAMATQAIFSFVGSWNNLYTPSLVLASNGAKLGTMPMFVSSLKSNDKQRDFGQIYFGLAITVVPIMIAYFLLSRYIVAGVALGGVKE